MERNFKFPNFLKAIVNILKKEIIPYEPQNLFICFWKSTNMHNPHSNNAAGYTGYGQMPGGMPQNPNLNRTSSYENCMNFFFK